MAIANEDGSIVIGIKLATQSIEKGLRDFKNKLKSSTKQENYFDVLKEKIFIARDALEEYKKEYAKLVAVGKQDSKEGVWFQSAIKKTESELKNLTTASSVLGKKSTQSFVAMANGAKNLGKRIAGIVKSALIFSLLYKVMQSVVKLFQNILMSDEEFRQDWEELKAAFYTAAYPIVNLIVPAIKFIVQQVRDWAVSIGKVAAALQGMSYSEFVNQAKASKEAADNYSDMEKSSKKTADNVKKQLASFDDIQILSSENEEEQGAGQYAGFEGLGQYDTSGEKSMLDDLMTAIGGALAAVGLILLFKGQISWGIGFIVAGAAIWAIGEIWGDEEFDPNEPKQVFEKIMETIEVSLMAVGIILMLRGLWQWGLGFLVAGAIIWGVKKIVANWDDIVAKVQKVFDDFGGIIAAAGAALIVLGIILCCTGVGFGLGIGLIIAGAAAITGAVVANWDEIVNWVKGAWEAVKGFWNKYIAPVFTAKFWLDLAKTCGNGLINGFENAINGIIGMFEKMINWIVNGLNKISFDVPDWVPGIGGKTFGFNIPEVKFGRVSIPRLAQGAVIPPNREFLAVLGDQKHGTNIEAPLQTIVDAFNIALQGNANYGGGNTEVVLEIDGREFGRAVVEQGNRENRRIGTRLVIV